MLDHYTTEAKELYSMQIFHNFKIFGKLKKTDYQYLKQISKVVFEDTKEISS
uniref:Uncharacterized protein n=1 Tax=Promethearchaeum syntrophicum TaxID=2594042 RepID=A0A5B9D8B6_9ARCH|nr:hypothetical protein DSAG12_00664 [Candidatus Prometheoarchaeum syntrophicum]